MTDQQPPTYPTPPASTEAPAPVAAPAPAGAPAYAAAPPAPVGPPLAPKTNTLAIISLIAAFFVSLAAVICGHIALSQIKKRGEGGRGLAIAGLILGYLGLAAGIVWLIIVFAVVIPASTSLVSKASDCTKVVTAGSTMITSVSTAFGEASTSPEKAQSDTKQATDTFKSETAGVKDAQVAADVKAVDAKLDAMNKAFSDLVASGGQGDPAALQTAAQDVDTAITDLTKTCTGVSK